ncbi:MAG: hypothetical protein HY698_08525 [Deltaproteobacteria bacterium]|nr:hypothetical protein [Deltaproteobacteria bacterium]
MKITGTGGVNPPGVSMAEAPGKVEAAGVGTPSEPARATTPPALSPGTSATDSVAGLAAELRKGCVSPPAVASCLVDVVVSSGHLLALPEQVRAALRAEFQRLVEDDPFVLSRLRRL